MTNTEKDITDPNDPFAGIQPMTIVPPSLHEQTLEQVLVTPVVVPGTDRHEIRLYDFFTNNNLRRLAHTISIRNSTKTNHLSQSTILATAMIHGQAIIEHELEDLFDKISAIYVDSVTDRYEMFESVFMSFKPAVNFGHDRLRAVLSSQDLEILSSRSYLLNINPGQFATACIIASLDGCEALSPELSTIVAKKHKYFIYSCNMVLDLLEKYKY